MTYRIFLDLEAEHTLLTVYGDGSAPLEFVTDKVFWNDPLADVTMGEQMRTNDLRNGLGWCDSWLAFGFASDQHKGIIEPLDTDGSINPDDTEGRTDGLLAVDRIPSTVNINLDLAAMKGEGGSSIATENGGWAVLGGVRGGTSENLVLIGQWTTTGSFSYRFNAQLRSPSGEVIQWRSVDPVDQ